MLIQFKRGPKSAIQTQSLIAGEPAFATDTRELFVGDGFTIGGVSISALGGAVTYISQDTPPPDPSDPVNAKVFWYETDTNFLYIWKYSGGAGAWERVLASGPTGPAGPAGPQGVQGIQGTQGIQGVRGATILNGTSAPTSSTVAIDGDYFLNTTTKELFGPRTTVNNIAFWGTGISLKGDTGEKGDKGDAGNQGAAGQDGAQGPRGFSVLNGAANPVDGAAPSGDGVDGDFWINRTTWQIFGPKNSGLWGAGYTLKGADSTVPGPQGIPGTNGLNGINGTNGLDGRTILNGSVAPTSSTGAVGDFYIQTITPPVLWGPKQVAGWPASGIALTGPKGDKGDKGDTGSAALWNFTGAYDGGRAYAVGDLATFEGKLFYRTNANGGNVGDTPYVGSTFWNLVVSGGLGFKWVGDYNDPAISVLTFSKNDVVEYDGSAYICITDNTNNIIPTTTANWNLLAARGEQGPEGKAGITDIKAVTPLNWDGATTTLKINDGTSQGQVLSWNGANWSPANIDPPILELSGLQDVSITTPSSGETLLYDATISKWVNGTPVSSLDDLTDVVITTPEIQHTLVYDGTNWVNIANSLDNLSDAVISNVTADDVLLYNGTNWINQSLTLGNISDVELTSPQDQEALVYNNGKWVNAKTVTEIKAKLPLEWDQTTSTVSIANGSNNGQLVVWDGKDWVTKNLNAITPLSLDNSTFDLTFGVSGAQGDILTYDAGGWRAVSARSLGSGGRGPSLLHGEGPPTPALGSNGDFYFDTLNHDLYGPKCGGCLNIQPGGSVFQWEGISARLHLIGPTGLTGPAGPTGPTGPQGAIGATGPSGPRGFSTSNIIHEKTASLAQVANLTTVNFNFATEGNEGDFLLLRVIDANSVEVSIRLYGKKENGSWTAYDNLTDYAELKGIQGATGAQGPQGIQGIPGVQGGQKIWNQQINGTFVNPSNSIGEDGDYYIIHHYDSGGTNLQNVYLYGPKENNVWPAGVSLRGQTGPTGAQGEQGPQGPTFIPSVLAPIAYDAGGQEFSFAALRNQNWINNIKGTPFNVAYRRSWMGI